MMSRSSESYSKKPCERLSNTASRVRVSSKMIPVHKKQLLTYLKLTGKRLGLLLNWNVPLLKEGITRIANGLPN